jgi:hypothetical protein
VVISKYPIDHEHEVSGGLRAVRLQLPTETRLAKAVVLVVGEHELDLAEALEGLL